jgi:malate/lactate dehydrogenase
MNDEILCQVAPDAWYLIVTNPINSTVPIFAEVLRQAGG